MAERKEVTSEASARGPSTGEQLWGYGLVLLVLLCCLLPVLLVSLGAWLVASGLEPPAWIYGIGAGLAVAGLILWHQRQRRRARGSPSHEQGDTQCQ